MRQDIQDAIDAVHKAFGAPGDWGYGTPKGDALFALYRCLTVTERVAELEAWREELTEVVGHLGSAVVQSCDKDDQIIMDHVKAAHEIAKIIRRKA